MIEPVKASLIWEDNPDTSLTSTNLSKMIDYQSESKFILFTDERSDYERWADLLIEVPLSVNSDPFTAYADVRYKDQVIYNISTYVAKKIVKDTTGSYTAEPYNSPYKKLLKVLANTKISMSYNNGIVCYNSFDIGNQNKIFSSDHLINESDFSANSTYDIYLYYHLSYGDYAQIKIANRNNDSWKTSQTDISSPSGYKIISYRNIGGFKTDNNGYIDVSSIWDISTLKSEIVVETLKKYDRDNDKIRLFSAADIPIVDTASIINATNVEVALEEIKSKVDKMYSDLYSVDKYGVELKFCNLKKNGTNIIDCVTNDLTLKITAGYIDVYGERIKIDQDIYLASPSSSVKINGSSNKTTPAYLGDKSSANNIVYDNSIDGSGTVWRVYINISGEVLLKEDSNSRPQYLYTGKLKGWYDTTSVARCIGKFKVRKSSFYFIEKQSVLNTIERQMIPNEIIIVHGTMCPDGTIPCDGKWHDTIGQDYNSYSERPNLSEWLNNKWYEETPNLWGRSLKMPTSNVLSTGPFRLTETGAVAGGGSAETGASGGTDTHTHTHPHSHASGTLKITDSGAHTHENVEFITIVNESIFVIPDQQSNSIKVTKDDHDHDMVISGGSHNHNSAEFSGTVAILQGSDAITDPASSWSPYKEVLFCIKK